MSQLQSLFFKNRSLNDYQQIDTDVNFPPRFNLKYLRDIGQDVRQQKPRPESQEFIDTDKVIKHAIRKYCPPQMADHIINDFRRSNGSDEAAELNFLKADEPFVPIKRDQHYSRALRVVEKLFRPSKKLRPIAFPDLRYYPWTLPTSAEAPYSLKQKWKNHVRTKHSLGLVSDARVNFHNLYNEIFNKNRTLVHQIKTKSEKFFSKKGIPIPYYWHTLHTRAHLVKSTDLDKNRAVFGTPKLLLMVENMFIWPMLKTYLNEEIDSPMLWGFETFKGGWLKLWNRFDKKRCSSFLGIDWSGFDRKAKFEVIDDVHNIWKSYFSFDDGYQPTNKYPETISQVPREKLENLWNWMTHSVKFTPILSASRRLYQFQWSGIASGFQETQLLDSFVNAIMLLTCLSSLGINIESEDFLIFIQGDDSVVGFPERYFDIYGRSFLDLLRKEADLRFGAVLSTDKSTFSNTLNDIEVLGYRSRYGIAFRDNAQLLAQLLYPERPTRDLGSLASACVGIAMASMGNSKILYDVCYDIWNFLINSWNVTPKPIRLARWLPDIEHIRVIGDVFPSLTQIKDQQYFWNKGRTDEEKQSLWPTDQNKNFFFL